MSKWINVREMQRLFLRLFLFFLLLLFFSLENNPLVRLEAIIGLSPSPIEKIFGVKSLLSGMTEGVHQMAFLNVQDALNANIFSPLVLPLLLLLFIRGKIPKIKTRKHELVFFSSFIFLSILVNVFN